MSVEEPSWFSRELRAGRGEVVSGRWHERWATLFYLRKSLLGACKGDGVGGSGLRSWCQKLVQSKCQAPGAERRKHGVFESQAGKERTGAGAGGRQCRMKSERQLDP